MQSRPVSTDETLALFSRTRVSRSPHSLPYLFAPARPSSLTLSLYLSFSLSLSLFLLPVRVFLRALLVLFP